MDATFVLTNCNWIMSELITVYHNLSTNDAQQLVATLVERRMPLIWEGANVRRVLDPSVPLKGQVLLLLATIVPGVVSTSRLFFWTGSGNRVYFERLLRDMHSKRLVELSADEQHVQILPPGSAQAGELVRAKTRVTPLKPVTRKRKGTSIPGASAQGL